MLDELIENSNFKNLSLTRLGLLLKKQGFKQYRVYSGKIRIRKYLVKEKDGKNDQYDDPSF